MVGSINKNHINGGGSRFIIDFTSHKKKSNLTRAASELMRGLSARCSEEQYKHLAPTHTSLHAKRALIGNK